MSRPELDRAGLGWAGLVRAYLHWAGLARAGLTHALFTADAAALLMDISCMLCLRKGA